MAAGGSLALNGDGMKEGRSLSIVFVQNISLQIFCYFLPLKRIVIFKVKIRIFFEVINKCNTEIGKREICLKAFASCPIISIRLYLPTPASLYTLLFLTSLYTRSSIATSIRAGAAVWKKNAGYLSDSLPTHLPLPDPRPTLTYSLLKPCNQQRTASFYRRYQRALLLITVVAAAATTPSLLYVRLYTADSRNQQAGRSAAVTVPSGSVLSRNHWLAFT